MNRTKTLLILAVFLVGVIMLKYGCYFFYQKYDKYRFPWAYSSQPDELFVGKWKGDYTDPDKIAHHLEMEIFVPITAEERWEKAFRKKRKRSRSQKSKTFYEGIAFITTNGVVDTFEVWGGLEKTLPPCALKSIHFAPIHDYKKQGFYINSPVSKWEKNKISMLTTMAYHDGKGSSKWSSDDPRLNQETKIILEKVK